MVALLKQERQRQGISCYKLAKGCGLSKTSIAYIEKNENKPTLRTLVMIADYLNVDLSEYLKVSLNE
ncbi:MAG: helix-turn-helix transcriptional regulator [Azospirillum sp.]|nr:helix-turn-helix transcriptional regulator [Azospirillum sp.]